MLFKLINEFNVLCVLKEKCTIMFVHFITFYFSILFYEFEARNDTSLLILFEKSFSLLFSIK